MSDINRIISGYHDAEDAAEYAEALRIEMVQESGTDFKMIWSDEHDGSYPPGKE